MKIVVLGSGSWGSTVANLIAQNKHDVVLWARDPSIAKDINDSHENKKYLPGVALQKNLSAKTEVSEVLADAEIIVNAIPTQFIRENLKQMSPHINTGATIVNISKGFEQGSFKRISELVKEEVAQANYAVLSGPNHAEEVSRKIPTASVIASNDADLSLLKEILETPFFKIYPHEDVVGVEVCGAMKNITAIAVGVVSSLGLGDNATGAIITLGLREIVKVGRELGAKQETCYGVAGIGDLIATCTSDKSRNRRVGKLISKGLDAKKIQEEMNGMVAEGVSTTKAVYEFAQSKKLSLPLTEQVYNVLYKKKNLENAIEDLKQLI